MSVNATTTVSIAPLSTSARSSSALNTRESYFARPASGGGPDGRPHRIHVDPFARLSGRGWCSVARNRREFVECAHGALEPLVRGHEPPDPYEQDHDADDERRVLHIAVVPGESGLARNTRRAERHAEEEARDEDLDDRDRCQHLVLVAER